MHVFFSKLFIKKAGGKTLILTYSFSADRAGSLYSGFAYRMLGIPEDLFTPLFAIARVSGWVAHNIENKLYDGRIMRPATKYVGETSDFVPMEKRK